METERVVGWVVLGLAHGGAATILRKEEDRWEVHSHPLLDCVLLVVKIIGFLGCLSSRPLWRPLTLLLFMDDDMFKCR